jgi:hypothetical protein
MKKTTRTILLAAAAAGIFIAGHTCGHTCGHRYHPDTPIDRLIASDTIFVRDTLRDTVFVPRERRTVRTDTIFVTPPGDTTRVEVPIPIEQKTYVTPHYRATVEGFNPALTELELYRTTPLVTRLATVSTPPKRWAIGIQAGYGITPKGAAPYLGVGIQYRISRD